MTANRFQPNTDGRNTTYMFKAMGITAIDSQLTRAGEIYSDIDKQLRMNFNAFEKEIIEGVNLLTTAGKNDVAADFTNRLTTLSKELYEFKQEKTTRETEFKSLGSTPSNNPNDQSKTFEKIEAHKRISTALQDKLKDLEVRFGALTKEVSIAKTKVPQMAALRPD